MISKKIIPLFLLLLMTVGINAQTARQEVIAANKLYHDGKLVEAKASYLAALKKDDKTHKADYNLGNTVFELGQADLAIEQYSDVAAYTDNESVKAKAFYNMGNAYYSKEKYEEAAEAFKNSLRINPNDMEAKENLMMALIQLAEKTEQEQEQQQNPDQQEQQDQENQEQQEGEQQEGEQQEGEPQDGEQQEGEQEEGEQQEGEQQEGEQGEDQEYKDGERETTEGEELEEMELSKEEAERLLEIMDEEERKVQERLIRGNNRNRSDKDW